ncbi:hypothetical protein EDB86DRAFT_222092 [Lactarius hatsudake]|nr:hypothetical protein EDB86DRAFT_222092 [Lactarius hatsudake]
MGSFFRVPTRREVVSLTPSRVKAFNLKCRVCTRYENPPPTAVARCGDSEDLRLIPPHLLSLCPALAHASHACMVLRSAPLPSPSQAPCPAPRFWDNSHFMEVSFGHPFPVAPYPTCYCIYDQVRMMTTASPTPQFRIPISSRMFQREIQQGYMCLFGLRGSALCPDCLQKSNLTSTVSCLCAPTPQCRWQSRKRFTWIWIISWEFHQETQLLALQ